MRETESLYLRAIEAARHTLYVETQYLASATIAERSGAACRKPTGRRSS